MSNLFAFAFILLAAGILLILAGTYGVWKDRKSNKGRPETNDVAPEQPKLSGKRKDVLSQMQQDEELRQKIMEEIEKKSG